MFSHNLGTFDYSFQPLWEIFRFLSAGSFSTQHNEVVLIVLRKWFLNQLSTLWDVLSSLARKDNSKRQTWSVSIKYLIVLIWWIDCCCWNDYLVCMERKLNNYAVFISKVHLSFKGVFRILRKSKKLDFYRICMKCRFNIPQ